MVDINSGSGSPGSNPDQSQYVALFRTTIYRHKFFLYPGIYSEWVLANFHVWQTSASNSFRLQRKQELHVRGPWIARVLCLKPLFIC